jgi:hypothetical protein
MTNLTQVPFAELTFIDNPEPRCPCVLLLDTSGSMSGQVSASKVSAVSNLISVAQDFAAMMTPLQLRLLCTLSCSALRWWSSLPGTGTQEWAMLASWRSFHRTANSRRQGQACRNREKADASHWRKWRRENAGKMPIIAEGRERRRRATLRRWQIHRMSNWERALYGLPARRFFNPSCVEKQERLRNRKERQEVEQSNLLSS